MPHAYPIACPAHAFREGHQLLFNRAPASLKTMTMYYAFEVDRHRFPQPSITNHGQRQYSLSTSLLLSPFWLPPAFLSPSR